MPSITDAKLTLRHDHVKKLVQATVTCKINFTVLELCQMRSCAQARHFRLKCQLWGGDSGLTGADDFLYTYSTVHYFPDASPNSPELRAFDVTLGEGVLDEDWGQDEVYGKLSLANLGSFSTITKKTNTVSHSF
jgi:hypothetical protein